MSAINFIGIGLALFLSFLLLNKKSKGNFDFILLTWLILNAIQLLFFYLNFEGFTNKFVPFLIAMGLIPYLISPLLFIYVSSLVQGPRFSWVRQLIHFAPYMIMLFSILWHYWLPSDTYNIRVSNGYINVNGELPFHVRHWASIMAFSAFIYPVSCLVKIYYHRSTIENEFSDLKEKTLDWMKYWIIIEIVAVWISFWIIVAGDYDLLDIGFSFKVIAAIIIMNVFVVGYFGVKQTNIFVDIPVDSNKENVIEKYGSSNLKSEDLDVLLTKLQAHMEKEKPYKNPSLNAGDVANSLGISKHQLSQTINQKTSKNFYEYVNQFRIDEFKNRVIKGEAEKMSILGVAFESGFNSKSTFNHIFKKLEGVTPSEYKKSII